jgi:redox-sensitive bicupin YhaK (pirin superfamily)
MEIEVLRAQERGIIKNKEFTGYTLFSNGQRGTGRRDNFGGVYVCNDDYLNPGSMVGLHPHANVEIVTIMVSGTESHRDTLGIHENYTSGDVQLISSGIGLQHAGGNVSSTEVARHLQIWIAPQVTGTTPTAQVRKVSATEPNNEWIPLLTPDGKPNTLAIKQNVWISRAALAGDSDIRYTLMQAGNGVMIYILHGQISVGGVLASEEDTLFITGARHLHIKANEQTALLLIETVL